MHTKDRGDIAEAFVLARFLQVGWIVAKPVGDNRRYDLIIDRGNGFETVQIKNGNFNNGNVEIDARSTGYLFEKGKPKYFAKKYNGEIDIIASYCDHTNKVYVIEMKNEKRAHFSLRVDNPKKSNPNIKWAKDYECTNL